MTHPSPPCSIILALMIRNITTAVLIVMVCAGIGNAQAAKNSDRPNILFFAYDDLRPLISAYGEPEPITPNLDALAKDGVRFDRNYMAYPLSNNSQPFPTAGFRGGRHSPLAAEGIVPYFVITSRNHSRNSARSAVGFNVHSAV